MFSIIPGAHYYLLGFLNVVLLACCPELLGVKKYKLPFALSLVGLISTVLVFTVANLAKFFFGLVLVLGCFGLVKVILRIQKNGLPVPHEQGWVFLYAFVCSTLLNYLHYPGFLYKVAGDAIQSRFDNPGVPYQSAMSSEILRSQGWSRLICPYSWPSKLHAYHIGGNALDAFAEIPFFPHNVVSYAVAHWVLVTCGIAYALFQGSQLFFSKRNSLLAVAFITLSSFFISLMGGSGTLYGVIAYSHYNSPSWWAGFFVLISLLCFWKKDTLWSFYFLWVSCCFKISFAPSALMITIFYLATKRGIDLLRYVSVALFPVCVFGFLILLSRTDRFNFEISASLRDSPSNFDLGEVREWSVEVYRRLYDLFFTQLPQEINHLPIFKWISNVYDSDVRLCFSWLSEKLMPASKWFLKIDDSLFHVFSTWLPREGEQFVIVKWPLRINDSFFYVCSIWLPRRLSMAMWPTDFSNEFKRLHIWGDWGVPQKVHCSFVGSPWLSEALSYIVGAGNATPGFLIILFQIAFPLAIVLFLGLIAFIRDKNLDINTQIANLVFLLACGLPALMFQTKSPYHQSVDPWITNIHMAVLLFAFCSASLLTTIFQPLFKQWGRWSLAAFITAVFICIRPACVRPGWETFHLSNKRKFIAKEKLLLEDDPLYAAFFDMRIYRGVHNHYGVEFSVKE